VDAGSGLLVNCISYSNTTANSCGFVLNGMNLLNCIAAYNGSDGFRITQNTSVQAINCDAYMNGGSGIDMSAASLCSALIRNCNLFTNSAYGIRSSGSASRIGVIQSCAFGTGTMTNALGNFDANINSGVYGGIIAQDSILFPANQTPWVDPGNGNFRITSSYAKAAGASSFTQSLINSPTNTVGFPDVGAAQSASTNAAAGGSYTFAQ